MKKISIFIFVFSMLILSVSLTVFLMGNRVIKTEILHASVNITNSLGFDVNGTSLTFGNILNDGSSTRNIIFENEYDIPVVAKISAEGDIKDLLIFEKVVFVEEGETIKIPIIAVSKNTDWGLYEGNVQVDVLPA